MIKRTINKHDESRSKYRQNNKALVQADQVCLEISGKQILQNVDLSVSAGECVTLIGPNGAGKTSLVRIILGLLNPSSGKIYRRRKLRIGYMPQKLNIDTNFPITVQRFLELAKNDKQAIKKALELINITKLAKTALVKVSGGEMQRVFLARAILRDPQLLVLDEPVQGVDIGGQTQLYQLINNIREEFACGVLMVSHDLHLVMAATDTVICLNHHVCCHGHPDSIISNPQYLSLFGEAAAPSLAVYTHHHDHQHDIGGDVIDEVITDAGNNRDRN